MTTLASIVCFLLIPAHIIVLVKGASRGLMGFEDCQQKWYPIAGGSTLNIVRYCSWPKSP